MWGTNYLRPRFFERWYEGNGTIMEEGVVKGGKRVHGWWRVHTWRY